MSDQIRVAVAGATGKLATEVIQNLLQKYPNVIVHGIARSPKKLNESIASNKRFQSFQSESGDLDSLRAGVRGTAVAICCYLGDDSLLVDGQKTLIDACIAEDVPRYIASDYSVDLQDMKLGEIPAKDFQLKIQAYLEEKEKEGKIKGVHILNGGFMETMFAHWFGYYDHSVPKLNVWGTGDEVLEVTTYADTAAFTASVAVDPSAVGWVQCKSDQIFSTSQ